MVESHDMNNKGKGKANKTSLKGSKCKCQQPIGRISLRPSHGGDVVFPVSTMAKSLEKPLLNLERQFMYLPTKNK